MFLLVWMGCAELPSGGNPSPPAPALDGNQWGEGSVPGPVLCGGRLQILSGRSLLAGRPFDAPLLDLVAPRDRGSAPRPA
jgi:hypothetical protein